MAADNKTQLTANIKAALDADSEKDITELPTPEAARQRLANAIADAVEGYVIGRMVNVTGVQPGVGSTTGLIV